MAKILGEYNIKKYLNNNYDLEKKILDFGCGSGKFLMELKNLGYKNLYGYDVTNDLINKDYLKNKIFNFILNEEKKMNNLLNHGPFDIIVFNGVCHHLEKPFETIEEIFQFHKNYKLKFICIEPTSTVLRNIAEKTIIDFKLGNIFFKNLYQCLINEWPTYKPWTLVSLKEIEKNLKKIGFNNIFLKKTFLNVEMVAENF